MVEKMILKKRNILQILLLMGFTLLLSVIVALGIWYVGPSTGHVSASGIEDVVDGQTQVLLWQNGSQVQGTGAKVYGNRIEITQGGEYVIAGSLLEGQIHVTAGKEEDVVLILAGMDVVNTSEAAIWIESARKAEIFLAEGTINRLQSGEAASSIAVSGKKGAIYAKCDLTIEGLGSLNVVGNFNNGILVTGNLRINSGTFQVKSRGDGIQAKAALEITGGEFHVTTGEGSEQASQKMRMGGRLLEFPDRERLSQEHREEEPDERKPGNHKKEEGNGEEETEISAKGMKCKTQMHISGGSFFLDTQDDALHSDGSIYIAGGSIVASTGDDGIHANTNLIVNNGVIYINKCFEGLEANQILIQGGKMFVTSFDDGVNAYGRSFSFEREGDTETIEELPNLCISGGSLTIDAGGDGLDSNGNILIEGGEILVNGPLDNGNGAIDSGREVGGTCQIRGGTILAIGSSGMAETFDETSGQYSFCHNFSQDFEAGDEIWIEDSLGTSLYQHTTMKSGNSIVFSCPELMLGEVYILHAGNQNVSIRLEQVSTSTGEQDDFFGEPGGHQPPKGFEDDKSSIPGGIENKESRE